MSRNASAWVITCIVSIATIVGCKARDSSKAQVKHTFGETAKPDDGVKVCSREEQKSENADVDQYLQKMLDFICSKNEQTCKGKFASQNICINLSKDLDRKYASKNAYSFLKENQILMSPSIFSILNNDAAVASIIAHELAHLTMQSYTHDDAPPEVVLHPDWLQIRRDSEEEQSKKSAELKILYEASDQSENARDKMVSKLKKTASDDLKNKVLYLAAVREKPSIVLGAGTDAAEFASMRSSIKKMQVPEFFGKFKPATDHSKANLRTDEAAKNLSEYSAYYKLVMDELEKSDTASYEAWLRENSALADVLNKIKAVEEKYSVASARMDAFINKLAPESRYNWTEQQADEVGLELYLRAGFAFEMFPAMEKGIMTPQAYQECIDKNVKQKVMPTRGMGTHPESCWRVYNFLVLEREFHKDDYAPLIKAASSVTLFPDELERVKKILSGK